MVDVIIHFDEIGLKGRNRYLFEKLLITNIKTKFHNLYNLDISYKKTHSQFLLSINLDKEKIIYILNSIPGIAYFSFVKIIPLDMDLIKKESLTFLKNEKFNTFKIDTKRQNKKFPLTSMQINQDIGSFILNNLSKKVDLNNPDIILKIEIIENSAYLSIKNYLGVGGLPTNPSQKVIALLSGGIDSPVASYLLMKRGCTIIFLHIKNNLQNSSIDKIISLVKQLSKYQINTKLYILDFSSFQKQLIMKIKPDLRMLIYRRLMFKLAELLSLKEGGKYLCVGDSLSQVASQTFDNIDAVYSSVDKIILSPLIGFDKKEIVKIAKNIGTYDISILPYGDCCTFFVSKHPSLRTTKLLLDKEESKLDLTNLQKLIDEAEIFIYK